MQKNPTDLADLKRKSVRGGMVTLVSQGISLAIQLASTVTLARILSPDDYGVMAMVMVITAFAGLFRDMGLSAASIQKGQLSQAQMSNLFWLNIAMGTMLTAALAAASPLVAKFYGKPELLPLTAFLSLSFIISSLGTQHGALMQRELQLGRRAVASITGALVSLAVSITLALHGYRYWALAWGMIVGSITTTSLLFILSPFRPGLWTSGAGVRSMLKFGANVTAFDLVNYFHRNLDSLLIGRFWGADALGLYTRAYSLMMLPINNLRGPINAVAFPALSRLQNEPEAFRTYYRRVTSLLAFLSMPLAAFLFVTSRPIIELLLGEQWLGAVPIFSILAIAGFIQPISSTRGIALMCLAKSKEYLFLGLLGSLMTTLGFLSGIKWGPIGVACGYTIAIYTLQIPAISYISKKSFLKVSDIAQPAYIPAAAALLAAIITKTVQPHFLSENNAQAIVVALVVFSAVYGLLSYLAYNLLTPNNPSPINDIFQSIRKQKPG